MTNPGRRQRSDAQLRVTGPEERLALGRSTPPADVLYAFGRGRIAIIEPNSTRIVGEITEGLEGTVWADCLVTSDNRLIFANDIANARVLVIDAENHRQGLLLPSSR